MKIIKVNNEIAPILTKLISELELLTMPNNYDTDKFIISTNESSGTNNFTIEFNDIHLDISYKKHLNYDGKIIELKSFNIATKDKKEYVIEIDNIYDVYKTSIDTVHLQKLINKMINLIQVITNSPEYLAVKLSEIVDNINKFTSNKDITINFVITDSIYDLVVKNTNAGKLIELKKDRNKPIYTALNNQITTMEIEPPYLAEIISYLNDNHIALATIALI